MIPLWQFSCSIEMWREEFWENFSWGCDRQRDSNFLLNPSLPVVTGKQEVVQVQTLEMAEVLVPAEGVQDPLEVGAHTNSMIHFFFIYIYV